MEKRFKNDDKLNKIYRLINETRFRNYIYDYGSEYCDYIDEYECAIDDRNDRIVDLEQQIKKQKEVIDKAIEYVNNHINQETFDGYMDSYELKKLLNILKEVSE